MSYFYWSLLFAVLMGLNLNEKDYIWVVLDFAMILWNIHNFNKEMKEKK